MLNVRNRMFLIVPALFSIVLTGACCSTCDQLEKNRDVVMRAAEALNNYDYDAMDAVFARDYKRHCQATPDVVVESLDDFKDLVRKWQSEFPDARMVDIVLTAEGDRVALWTTWTATAGGESIRVDVGGMHRIRDGKIAETWATWDNVTLLTQMGMYPPSAPESQEVE